MVPVPAAESRTLWIVGATRATPGKPTRSQLIETLRALGSTGPQLVAVFDARSIASERHLLSAWAHLGRSRARGEERLRDRGAEFALYVAGDDQLPRALQKVGFQTDTESFVVVGERPRTPAEILAKFGLQEDPAAYPRPLAAVTLDRLGITADDRQVVPESAWEGLVLERIAMLELSAGHAPGRPAAQTS
jgi:tRNA threonylcarbamoyladenosine modification (KEOPS) complex Cgi121 subunit